MEDNRKSTSNRLAAPLMETFGISRVIALGVILLISVIVVFAVWWFFHSAPPRTITITSGPPGSMFETNAIRYARILASNGVTLKILPSGGSGENLRRLNDPSFHVDIGFVQGGITNATNALKLVSLGSITYEPLMIFYRSTTPLTLLSELRGHRISIGAAGGGTHTLALTLLKLNGLDPADVKLVDLNASDISRALLDNHVDAVFLMGDSASPQLMRQLLLAPGIQLFNFTQADGYVRRISYLNKLELPKGSLDFGRDVPAQDTFIVGPTVELLARPDLHPALSDLLLGAAREVHGNAGLLKRKGEFPAALEHDFPLSTDAARYYKSGKSFLYRYLPFWLASLVNRALVAFVPMIVVLIPAIRIIPAAYKWRMRLLIYRRYRALLALERDILIDRLDPVKQKEFLARLDEIEKTVNQTKIPASFADQFYALRTYIVFVRVQLAQSQVAK